MQLALAIVTAVVSLAGLAWKWYSSRKAAATAEVELSKERGRAALLAVALSKAREAEKERAKYVDKLHTSIQAHLESCNTPLAGWANELLGKPKTGEPGKPS